MVMAIALPAVRSCVPSGRHRSPDGKYSGFVGDLIQDGWTIAKELVADSSGWWQKFICRLGCKAVNSCQAYSLFCFILVK